MVFEGATRFSRRLRPREGWPGLILLLALIAVLDTAVLSVGWVPEDRIVVLATVGGLLLGAVLAKRQVGPWFAWMLISAYGLLIVGATLGQLWPGPELLRGEWAGQRAAWLENGAEFVERSADWSTAVAAGSRSNETIVFALILGLLAWFLAAYLGWSAYRRRRPLPALLLLGLLLGFNGYFGGAPLELAAIFVGLAVLAAAVFHLSDLEATWEQQQVDYSTQIRFDVAGYAAGIGLALLALSFLVPTFRISSAARLFLNNEQVIALEERLDLAFGGVETQRVAAPAPGAPGGSGILPRSFLLGSGPELEKFIMMTATAEIVAAPPEATLDLARHWRGLSYEVYTGEGWALAAEEEERAFAPGAPLPQTSVEQQMHLRQEVHWRYDNRGTRYSLGLPERIDQASTAVYRGDTNLIRLLGKGPVRYAIESRLPAPSAEDLRGTAPGAIPRPIQQRYTNLPAGVPRRVGELAAEVTAGAETPYDQALALEAFLRQYPYDLNIPLPPPDVDVVDYFLFEAQRGYCDYYASAMAVLARTLGLPARVATGYLAPEADSAGVQTIRQSDAHSWTEIYFAGYGWVEFEPTAAFASPHVAGSYAQSGAVVPWATPAADPQPLPPQKAAQRSWPWAWLAAAAALTALAVLVWRAARQPRPKGDEVQRAYGRLQLGVARLGQPLSPSQTPEEFDAALQERLRGMGTAGRRATWARRLSDPAGRLVALFQARQYGGRQPAAAEVREMWGRIRRPIWALWLSRVARSTAPAPDDGDERERSPGG